MGYEWIIIINLIIVVAGFIATLTKIGRIAGIYEERFKNIGQRVQIMETKYDNCDVRVRIHQTESEVDEVQRDIVALKTGLPVELKNLEKKIEGFEKQMCYLQKGLTGIRIVRDYEKQEK